MEEYLSKKYHLYSKDSKQKLFTFEHISEELLCCNATAKNHIKNILNKAHENINFEQFSKVVCIAIDLE